MTYLDILQAIQYQEHSAVANVPDTWQQGRSLFGGLQAALNLMAMRTLTPHDIPLRTLQTTFMAPVPAGSVSANAKTLRSGKNTHHVQAVIGKPDQPQCSCIAVFGHSRPSAVNRTMAPPPPEGAAKPFLYMDGLTPNFTRYFDARWLSGDLPFSNSSLNHALVEVSMKESGTTSEAHLLAIADFIPPLALAKLAVPAAGSSLTWMLEILDTDFQQEPLQGWQVAAEMTAAGEGYTS